MLSLKILKGVIRRMVNTMTQKKKDEKTNHGIHRFDAY
jgi:hypothetical protein